MTTTHHMVVWFIKSYIFVAALLIAVTTCVLALPSGFAYADGVLQDNRTQPSSADTKLDALFADLQAPGEGWRMAETEILRLWSMSGSASMDVLLQRGVAALDEGDLPSALAHLTALTDHAPDFAEGWAARGAAFAGALQFGPAAADLARALALEPRHFPSLTLLCGMLEDMGSHDVATEACQLSLTIHPNQPEAIDTLSRLVETRDGILM